MLTTKPSGVEARIAMLGRMAEEARERRQRDELEAGGEDRERPLDPAPAAFDPVDRRAERKDEEAGVAGGLHHAGGDVLEKTARGHCCSQAQKKKTWPGLKYIA